MDVITAYINRVEAVNPYLNAVIHDRFEKALIEAEKADQFLLTSGLSVDDLKEKYPLLGVPVTVKGCIAVAGLQNTSGTVYRKEIADKDAVIVANLRKTGAIPLLTSNVPELCMNWETNNKLIGVTNNPYDTRRTPGGSSGGEAALISSGASIIGIGSDLAGSLRLPAHYCGIFSHKPTPCVVSSVGHYPICTDLENWTKLLTLGPMCRYGSDLKLTLESIMEPQYKTKLNLNEPVNIKDLKVYYLRNCNESLGQQWSPSVRKVYEQTVQDLKKICPNCREANLPLMKWANILSFIVGFELDGISNLPGLHGRGIGIAKEILKYITFRSDHMFMPIFYNLIRRSLHLLPKSFTDKVHHDIDVLEKQLYDLLDDNTVLLLPTFFSTALFHDLTKANMLDAGILSIFNALGLPATNCPIGMDENGLPIGMQIVTGQYYDRLSISLAQEVEKIRGGWKPPCPINANA